MLVIPLTDFTHNVETYLDKAVHEFSLDDIKFERISTLSVVINFLLHIVILACFMVGICVF